MQINQSSAAILGLLELFLNLVVFLQESILLLASSLERPSWLEKAEPPVPLTDVLENGEIEIFDANSWHVIF